MEPHVQRFDIFGHTVRLARPMATSLSQKISGWGWPRFVRIGGGRGLGVAEVREDCPLVHGDASCREEAAVFGLRDKGAYDRDAGRVGGDGVVDGIVGEEGRCVVAHVMGRASDGPSSRTGEIGRIRMDAQNHFGGLIDFAPIRMGRDKAEETVKAGHGGEGGRGLFGS
jgi:hypothetical protein